MPPRFVLEAIGEAVVGGLYGIGLAYVVAIVFGGGFSWLLGIWPP